MLGVLLSLANVFLGYATKRNDNTTIKALETIKGEIEANRAVAEIAKAKLGHWIAWLPAFFIETAVAIYFTAVILDSVFNLSGDVLALPANEASVMMTVIGGMFVKRVFGK
jgi:hypothetical protein